MSHGRKPILQLDERGTSSPLRNKTAVVEEEEDDDSMGDMPTPERLVEQDLPTFGQQAATSKPRDIDDKVANFLAEIDALQPGDENSSSPPPPKIPVEREEESPPRFTQPSPPPPARDNTPPPPRTKPGAYSNMFVKGTPEFVKKKDEKKSEHESKVQLEPWPEEPKTEWQQLMDENTNYPYYWHTVTNDVVWDMPPEFSKYLILKKEYEEKVEKGLKDGTLDPSKRSVKELVKAQESPVPHPKLKDSLPDVKQESLDKKRQLSHSEDSSSDSSDSDDDRHKKPRKESTQEVPSTAKHKDSEKEKSSTKEKKPDLSNLLETTETKKITPPTEEVGGTEESMDFDIDDIDKELERALERKRQELMSKEENKKEKEKDTDKERSKDKDRRRRDDDRKSDRHRDRRRDEDRRKHKHRDRDRDRDRDREKDRDSKDRDKRHKDIEPDVPKLTLKERLRMEMELKLEKERKMKKALIEEMMAKELEKTVASSFSRGSMKRGRDDLDRNESRKRYRDDGEPRRHGSRDKDDSRHGVYDGWDRRGSFNDDYSAPLKPPPPTAEMLAYEEERRSEVVDYGHGRSRKYDQNGDSDPEDTRPADIRDIEMKKLEALQLAELALSKLEFLEVSKKGLSKLQILLIELETRHLDWQAGGLTTNHFLTKLRETNRQLEQYEGSAAPSGWACSWDRDYRRYFYTHKVTGKTQWDYPDADDIRLEDAKVKEGKEKPKMEVAPGTNSTNEQLQGFSVEKDLTQEILASVSLPPPPPPPAEEHPSVKSLQLMYGSSSDSEAEEPATKNKDKSDKEEKPPPPLPPLPKEEKHTEKEKKHKSKKKKKEKSKRKEQEQGVVGPVYPDPATVTGAESYSEGMMTYDPTHSGEMAYSDPQALEAWYTAQGQTGSEIPVYGQVAGPEAYTQNDQPLEFGTVPEGGYPTAGEGGDSSYHPPETYKAVPTVYSESNGAGDGVQSTSTESQDGLNIEIGTLIPPNTEEKKKKKKEKMGSSNISLKKKHVSSMVQKWQKVKKEVELEERDREIREAEIRRKLAELD